jgi:pimeloyl-ACP methyl ester carboxylesterase
VAAAATERETFVRSRGLELYVRERGEGHPLLLINGLGGNVEMWGVAEERLSAVARTIVFDPPGTGRSSMPHWPLSIRALAGLAAAVLDELGHERVDVLGYSLGGLVAQQLARDEPARVRRLALAATACGWGSMPGSLDALALVSMPLRYHSRSAYERTNRLLSPADAELVDRVPQLAHARLRYPPSLLAYTWQLWAGSTWTSLPWLRTLRVPTLIVHGDADRLIPPANAVQLTRLLPESRLHVLRDEGHLIVFDPASAALPLVEDFVTSPTARDSTAWTTGQAVDDDKAVEAAFADSVGAQPYRFLSAAFRRLHH